MLDTNSKTRNELHEESKRLADEWLKSHKPAKAKKSERKYIQRYQASTGE